MNDVAMPFPPDTDIGQSYGFPYTRSTNDELTKWMLDMSDLLEEIEYILKGKWRNPSTGKWEDRFKPMINDNGISAIMLTLRMSLSKNPTLSWLDIGEINRMAYETYESLVELLFINHEYFELKEEYMDIIITSIDHAIFSLLKRALGGGERKALGEMTHRIENVNRQIEERGRAGIFPGR